MYGAYLRKSRADLSLEKNSGLDTLKRHKELLQKYAREHNIVISKWWEEIISAETIENRPEVQKMLFELETGKYIGILVVDIDRLARGDTADQAKILKTFSYSNTKIITPTKTYDPNDESDEEFFEFGLFMSRREYKLINKRLNRGRLASVNEGKYIGSICPYGYTKEKIKKEKGYRLIPLEEEAKFVKIIFQQASLNKSYTKIAKMLNTLGAKPRKTAYWSYSTIKDILSNPTYYGMLRWNYRKTEKKLINGKIAKTRPKHQEYILVKGCHQPLITKEIFDKVNKKREYSKREKNLQNPLAGLIKCSFCNRTIQRKKGKKTEQLFLLCPNPYCHNSSNNFQIIEEKILKALISYISETPLLLNYPTKNNSVKIENELNSNIENQLKIKKNQLEKAYTLLEQDIYDVDTFSKREKYLKREIKNLEDLKNSNKVQIKENNICSNIPNIKKILQNYHLLNIKEKNILLKSLIHHIEYQKIKKKKLVTLKIFFNI